MEPDQPGRANHGDDIDDLIRTCPTERSQTPLQHVGENRHDQGRPDARTGKPWNTENTPDCGRFLFHADTV